MKWDAVPPGTEGLAIDWPRALGVEAMRGMIDVIREKNLGRDADKCWAAVQTAVEAAMEWRESVSMHDLHTPCLWN